MSMIGFKVVANALLLLIVANLIPWALGRLCGTRWSAPLDFGTRLRDGHRLFGEHKTWRGLLAAIVGCAAVAEMLQLSWSLGAEFALLSMLGDCISSAWKRRRGYSPGRDTLWLDQLPEALLPLVILRIPLGLGWVQLAGVAAVFTALDAVSLKARHPRVHQLGAANRPSDPADP